MAQDLQRVSEELMDLLPNWPLNRSEVKNLRSIVTRREPFPAGLAEALPESLKPRLGDYDRLATGLAVAREQGKLVFEEELVGGRRWLREIIAAKLFQEAVFLSNPMAWERLHSYLKQRAEDEPNSDRRRIERLIVTYLQRFCVKNETTSFFGPTRYGRIVSGDRILVATPGNRLSQRRLFFAHWAAREIGVALIDAPSPVIQRRPSQNRGHIVEQTSDPRPPSPVDIIPVNTWSPLEFLTPADSRLRVGAERWSQVWRLKESLGRFPLASFEEKRRLLADMNEVFREVTGKEPTRNHGQTYSDRQIVYEDCEYEIPDLSLGTPVIDLLVKEYSEVLEALILPGLIRFQALRQAFHEWLTSLVGQGGSARFLRVNSVLQAQPEIGQEIEERATAWADERMRKLIDWLGRLAEAHSGQSAVSLGPETRAVLQSLVRELRPALDWPCVFSLDLLLAAKNQEAINDGDFKIVLGEVHPSMGVSGYYSVLYQDREKLKESLEAMLTGFNHGRQPVNFLTPAHNKTFITTDLGFPDIEYAGRALPHKRRIHPSDLYLECHQDDVALRADGLADPLFIYNKLPHVLKLLPLRVFAYPICSMEELARAWRGRLSHTPRLECGPIVIFRESWDTTAGALRRRLSGAANFDLFCQAQELRQAWGLPRCIFVRAEGEAKPLYLDFDSWLLLDMVAARLKKLPDSARVALTEMNPTTEDLWLRDAQGDRTCEFRLTFFHGMARNEI
jgi:hypothetical protein